MAFHGGVVSVEVITHPSPTSLESTNTCCVQRMLGDNHVIVQSSLQNRPERLQTRNHALAGTTEPTIGYLYLHVNVQKGLACMRTVGSKRP